jgi:putative transposase
MRKSRFTDEQIVAIVHEAESGARAAEVCRRHGISKETLRRWRVKYRGMEVQEAKRLKALEEENRRLKRLVAELALDNSLLKDVVGRKW